MLPAIASETVSLGPYTHFKSTEEVIFLDAVKYLWISDTFQINKAIMGPSTQQFFFSSSDVIATTCFGHTTIIKQHTVVYCFKLFPWLQSS
jgi:hypothetical protein